MNSLDTEFHRRLIRRIDEEAAHDVEGLLSGTMDHLDYKRVCGRIRALSDVKVWAEEIETQMNEGK